MLNYPLDLCKSFIRKVLTGLNEVEHLYEPFEFPGLGGPQPISLKERNDLRPQFLQRTDAVSIQILTMIIVTSIHVYAPTSEEILQDLQSFQATLSLSHNEFRENLPSAAHRWIFEDTYGKASLPIDEPGDPPLGLQSFLLIVRTHRIVTAQF